jgi:hypothetical protein
VRAPFWITTTSRSHTVSVRPGRITWPLASNRSPSAGASRLILYFTLSTEEPAGISV